MIRLSCGRQIFIIIVISIFVMFFIVISIFVNAIFVISIFVIITEINLYLFIIALVIFLIIDYSILSKYLHYLIIKFIS